MKKLTILLLTALTVLTSCEKETFEDELKAAQAEIARLENQIDNLQDLVDANADMSIELNNAIANAQRAENTLVNIENQLAAALAQNTADAATIADLNSRLEAAQALESQIIALNARIATLEAMNNQQAQTIADLQAAGTETITVTETVILEVEVPVIERVIDTVEVAVTRVVTQVVREVVTETVEVPVVQIVTNTVTQTVIEYRESAEAATRIASLTAELALVQHHLDGARAQNQGLLQVHQAMFNNIDRLNAQIAALTAARDNAIADVSSLQTQLDAANATIAALQLQINNNNNQEVTTPPTRVTSSTTSVSRTETYFTVDGAQFTTAQQAFNATIETITQALDMTVEQYRNTPNTPVIYVQEYNVVITTSTTTYSDNRTPEVNESRANPTWVRTIEFDTN